MAPQADPEVTRTFATPTGETPAPPAVFVAGTLIAGRYRIANQAGRGGMGQVYRAEDTKLGHDVALKFLPPDLCGDGAALARFHREVRVARQVAHPNVCRMFDVAEHQGRHFLAMEYVDGEDLASLLRRIGRVPADKGVDIARQICAGLAAAHAQGILHRDLKPANIMLDSRGKVRITDFGLASAARDIGAAEIRSGTPAYMAPEQWRGEAVSQTSDIYSLGLVLYEMFTGKRAVSEDGDRTTSTDASAVIRDLDPMIDRVIRRCLDQDPARRPASALEVAAALPGGDPLAAALAAGETPSPEMVAAAGGRAGEMTTVSAVLALAGVVGLTALVIALSAGTSLYSQLPAEKDPAVLADTAEKVMASAGAEEAIVHHGFGHDEPVLMRASRDPGLREALRTGIPATLYFWYRHSMMPRAASRQVYFTYTDPPMMIPGEARLKLDVRGRLVEYESVPEPHVEPGAAQPDWKPLLAAAGVKPEQCAPADPDRTPPQFAAVRAAWTTPHPDLPQQSMRIEAAAVNGVPVWFHVFYPPDAPRRTGDRRPPGRRLVGILLVTGLTTIVCLAALFLARRNLRLGRGDRPGARKIASFAALCELAAQVMSADHSSVLPAEFPVLYESAAAALITGAAVWILYIALEPYARRLCPRLLISWNRLLAGGWHDPMVARDVLCGGLLGLACAAATFAGDAHAASAPFRTVSPLILSSNWQAAATLAGFAERALAGGMLLCLFYLLLFAAVRRESWAAALFAVVALGILLVSGPPRWPLWPLVSAVSITLALWRFGMLGAVSWLLYWTLLISFPVTMDFQRFYVLQGWTGVAGVAIVSLVAANRAVAGGLLSRLLPD
ncbi:MAG: serine/threonine protein kinase [Acidobacteria bacterium]|nr:serine/threonine protein kinase [Acidobacteriota bacterium]